MGRAGGWGLGDLRNVTSKASRDPATRKSLEKQQTSCHFLTYFRPKQKARQSRQIKTIAKQMAPQDRQTDSETTQGGFQGTSGNLLGDTSDSLPRPTDEEWGIWGMGCGSMGYGEYSKWGLGPFGGMGMAGRNLGSKSEEN